MVWANYIIGTNSTQQQGSQQPVPAPLPAERTRHAHAQVGLRQLHHLAGLVRKAARDAARTVEVHAEDEGRQQRFVVAVVGVDRAGEVESQGGEADGADRVVGVCVPAVQKEALVLEPPGAVVES